MSGLPEITPDSYCLDDFTDIEISFLKIVGEKKGDFPFTGFFAAKKEQLRVSNRKFSRFQQIALCWGEKGRMGKAAVSVTPGCKVRYSFDQFILFHTAVS